MVGRKAEQIRDVVGWVLVTVGPVVGGKVGRIVVFRGDALVVTRPGRVGGVGVRMGRRAVGMERRDLCVRDVVDPLRRPRARGPLVALVNERPTRVVGIGFDGVGV